MEDIWFKDFKNFFNKENLLVFFPSSEMTTKEQLNSIFRFSIYFTVVMLLISNNYKYIYILLFTGLITSIMYIINQQQYNKKKILLEKDNLELLKNTNKLCTKPTKNNPFMNLTINEIIENPNKKPACDFNIDTINKSIKQNFNTGLYRSVDDIFEKNASDRQFYTTPNTEIVNDQTGLAEWLYKTPKTCKEDGISCFKNTYRYAVN
jgi:hypothetical protein